jgi:hypothetical protein
MSYLKLVGSLFFFTTAFAFMGMATSVDAGRGPWPRTIAGGLVGIFFGLVFGGGMRGGKLLDVLYPPSRRGQEVPDD